ncbi:MAG: hypothetical protein FWG03_04650 [Clostridiales bacterium]|nr:hypothetical protein [Clostridiales bacterium]
MALSYDSKLGELMDNPDYKAIFDKHIPGLSSNPMVAMGKKLAIKYLLKQPQAKGLGFTQETVDAIIAECNELG